MKRRPHAYSRRLSMKRRQVWRVPLHDRRVTTIVVFGIVFAFASALVLAQNDPGVRGGAAGAGGPVAGLTIKEGKFFDSGLDSFGEVASVTGSVAGTEPGLGPRFNLTGCAGCHAAPAIGGTSPA